MEEKYYIRRFLKVFNEKGTDRYYWFDIEKYLKLAAKFDFNAESLVKQIDQIEEDEEKIPSAKTIGRVKGFYDGRKEGDKDNRFKDMGIKIETAKWLGKALCDGDEYGLLIPIEQSSIIQVMKQGEEIWGASDINYIYSLMNKLLYELEPSSYYSYEPGTREDGFEYYDMRLQTIRNEIDSRFWNKSEIRDKLYRLVSEEEELIKSYSQPGAPERWITANPKLRYYDCVFDFMEESPELYEEIKKRSVVFVPGIGSAIHFSFYPTEQECEDRRKYFAELIKKSRKQNSKYTMDRFYQNELVDAFRLVFSEEFV